MLVNRGGGGGGTNCSKRDKDEDHPPPLHLVLYTNCFTSTMKIHHPSNKGIERSHKFFCL